MTTFDTTAERTTVYDLVIGGLHDLLAEQERPIPADLGEATRLLGKEATLDSLGLVTLIVDLEARIEDRFDIALTLADERAMSQQRSPFRTIGALTDYICTLLAEER
ncbi:MAG: acyl carrier protein [Oscillochloris sp.]|nr:acyl carrier protein [Oscillochloris sp.]